MRFAITILAMALFSIGPWDGVAKAQSRLTQVHGSLRSSSDVARLGERRGPILESAIRHASQLPAARQGTGGDSPSFTVPKGRAVGGLVAGVIGAIWLIAELQRPDGWLQTNLNGGDSGFSTEGPWSAGVERGIDCRRVLDFEFSGQAART